MDTFAAPAEAWKSLDPRYVTMKRQLVLGVWGVELVIAVVVLGLAWRWWAAGLLAAVELCWIGYRWHRVARVYRMAGWCEGATELCIREGLLFRKLTVVPYGRMQVVTVNSGPLERHHGLATVTLETASASTDATIPGLAVADAEALRERLSALGEHQAVGL